ncbi:hos4 protein [Aspergillus wentii]|nr:hos4 protein [Aspergillus wentii]
MSDVEAVSSLPAALDVGQSALAVKVNHQKLSGPPSPKRASPPSHPRGEDVPKKKANPAADGDEPSSPKADSEAETIIQSGRESLSPEKRRKYIKHDPKRRDDGNDNVDAVEGDLPPNDLQVRKRKGSRDDSQEGSDHDVRPTSLPPRVPSPSVVKIEKPEESQNFARKRESSHAGASIPKSDKARISRKRSFSESVDGDGDGYRRARQNPGVSRDRGRKDMNGIYFARPASNDRSVSPIRPSHKRTASGPQLGGSDVYRKRKAPTPLITGFQRQSSEDRQSISSSTSGSPLPSAHLRKLASVDGASASPARPMGHKKQRDQNGRTRLARACAAQELEVAMARHAERPDDLNVADNAGNTPLQIASLEGCAPIVKFLLEAGCEIDTKNIDKDTPLIDAVENGHLDVVKLLLEAGANPRTVNAEGDEPYELAPSDSDDYDEIRRVLAEAKANPRPGRRSEERAGTGNREFPSRRTSAVSPRDSPPVNGPRSPPLFSAAAKRKSVRSEATRNDLLWTKATPENLQAFAAKGDIAGVANILNVGQKADADSMIAAAKGGHDEVLSLLLGMGYADPDPDPVQSHKAGYSTPMLAAIGRGNLAVIRLLLDQPGFNPTRRFRGHTYFDLSEDRKGENWEDESSLLRDAYDNYSRTRKPRKADLSSPRRPRDREKENKRPARRDSISPVARPRKTNGSPGDSNRDSFSKDPGLLKERRRDGVGHLKEKANSGTSRPKSFRRESSDNPTSDGDAPRLESSRPKAHSSAKDSEYAAAARADDMPKRRRLIPGRPPQRRPSLISSDSLSGRDENTKPRLENPPDAPPSKHGPPPLKRVRSSESPDGPRSRGPETDRHSHETQKKKRRVLSEDGAPNLTNGSTKKTQDSRHKNDVNDDRPTDLGRDQLHKRISNHKVVDRNPVKQERERHEARGLDAIPMEDSKSAAKKAEAEAEERRLAETKKAEEERIAELAEDKRIAAEAERAREAKEQEERAAQLAREKAEEEERRRKEAEQRRVKQAEDERQKRLEQERARLAKLRREQEEQEQRRRDALPSRLRAAANLVGSSDPRAKSHTWLRKFMPVVTAQTKQLDPSCQPDVANEKWVPNYLIAPLLATNDLQLSQYATWEKRRATSTQRINLWRVTRRMLVQADEAEFHNSSFGQVMQKDCETRPKYFDMEHVFWVRLSDFMDLVPHIPHLHGLDIQFLRMHIDHEPSPEAPVLELPQPNGHTKVAIKMVRTPRTKNWAIQSTCLSQSIMKRRRWMLTTSLTVGRRRDHVQPPCRGR